MFLKVKKLNDSIRFDRARFFLITMQRYDGGKGESKSGKVPGTFLYGGLRTALMLPLFLSNGIVPNIRPNINELTFYPASKLRSPVGMIPSIPFSLSKDHISRVS